MSDKITDAVDQAGRALATLMGSFETLACELRVAQREIVGLHRKVVELQNGKAEPRFKLERQTHGEGQ